MKERLRRFLLLILVALEAIFAFGYAEAHESITTIIEDVSPQPSIPPQPSAPQKLIPEQQHRKHLTSEGSELVEKALHLLWQLEPSTIHSSSRKGHGIFLTVVHYAKEFVPRLYITGPSEKSKGSAHSQQRLKGPLSEAVAFLEEAATRHNPDAIYLLAQMSFFGNYTYPKNYTEAFMRYMELAHLDGNSSAQYMVGFMYATGFGGGVERDQAKAMLYHTFAAQAGYTKSEMTVAFRHHSGIATARDCDEAAYYYKRVADKAIKWYRSGPPGGRYWVQDSYRLADEDGGVYGEGASVSSAGINAQRGGPNSDANAALDDVLEYLDLMSGKGDFKATFHLGRIHYEGQKDLKRDLKAAKRYFQLVASQSWKRDGTKIENSDKPGLEKIACKAAGYLGRMYLRGEGVERNYKMAIKWYERGIRGGDAGSEYGIGLMYLKGLGFPKNVEKATAYFTAAAEQGDPSAQVSLGALYLDQGGPDDIQAATHYFENAARYGLIEAYYYLAEIINQGIGRDRSCGLATAYYKAVAEKVEPLVSSFAEANQAFEKYDDELALIGYMMAAEQGYEKGQANVAYMLDHQKSMLALPSLSLFQKPRSPLLQNPVLALIYWTRSAKQSNIDSLVKMGDYYLHGVGADVDMEKAAACYTAASEYQQSAQALYNLGWMHENGRGLNQDFHLAKRLYDQALETNQEAYLPVTLSLFKLRLRSAWNTLTNGRINSIRDEPAPKKQWSLGEWINNFLEEDLRRFEDFEDDDFSLQNDAIPGEEDMYDEVIDNGILETFIIIGLVAALVWLLYYRQQRQQAHRRQEEVARAQVAGQPAPVQQQQDADRGLFPPPGDPAFPEWVAGGVGH